MRIQPSEAISRLKKLGVKGTRKVPASTHIKFAGGFGDNEHHTIYFLGQGNRVFITPADDSVRPLLADCEKLDLTEELPPSLVDLLGEYDRQITMYQNSGMSMEVGDDMLSDADRQTVQPLLKTVWSQGAPYNDRLLFNGQKCLVGCVALSMAQILYYWGKIGKDGKLYYRGCMACPAYTTRTSKYKVDALPPITKFDYNHLTQKTPASAASIKAMSVLLEYCGKSLQSNYGTSVTSAYNVAARDVLKTHFRMGSPVIIYASSGEAKFEERIYNELVNGRPIMIAGYRAGGYGHMFNCDGFKRDTYGSTYHFNFGWGGSGDGWYAMTAIKPKQDREYTINLSAIIGIEPTFMLGDANGDDKVDISDVTTVVRDSLNGNNRPQSDVNSDGIVDVTDAKYLADKIIGK